MSVCTIQYNTIQYHTCQPGYLHNYLSLCRKRRGDRSRHKPNMYCTYTPPFTIEGREIDPSSNKPLHPYTYPPFFALWPFYNDSSIPIVMYRPNEIHSLLQWGGDFLCLYEINVTKPFSTHRVIAPGRDARLWGGGSGGGGGKGYMSPQTVAYQCVCL